MKPGDVVVVTLPVPGNSNAQGGGDAVVIGVPNWSSDQSVLVVATKQHIGMPVHYSWLLSQGKSSPEWQQLRNRYTTAFPGALRPE
jgi:hypothetical protein